MKSDINYDEMNDFLNDVKCLFGFGDDPAQITIVMPNVKRCRSSSLICQNYPLFEYEMSPDDVFTALRIYSMLVLIYGDKVNVGFPKDLRPNGLEHRIYIGSPVTNKSSIYALKNQFYSFGSNEDNDHDIVSKTGEKYTVLLNGDDKTPLSERQVIMDYALISKCSHHGTIEVVLAGCRAFGQMALWKILKDKNFYKDVLPKIKGEEFQILSQITVEGFDCNRWKIVDVRNINDQKIISKPTEQKIVSFPL